MAKIAIDQEKYHGRSIAYSSSWPSHFTLGAELKVEGSIRCLFLPRFEIGRDQFGETGGSWILEQKLEDVERAC